MSQDTISGSPNRLDDCESNGFTEIQPHQQKSSSTQLQFDEEQTSNLPYPCKSTRSAPPQSPNGAAALNDGSSNVASSYHCKNIRLACQTEDNSSTESQRNAFMQQQEQFLNLLTPQQQTFEKIKTIVLSQLREADPTLTLGHFDVLFESFVKYYAEHQTLPPSLVTMAQKLNDKNEMLKSCIKYFSDDMLKVQQRIDDLKKRLVQRAKK